jgi:hypothetical protein
MVNGKDEQAPTVFHSCARANPYTGMTFVSWIVTEPLK